MKQPWRHDHGVSSVPRNTLVGTENRRKLQSNNCMSAKNNALRDTFRVACMLGTLFTVVFTGILYLKLPSYPRTLPVENATPAPQVKQELDADLAREAELRAMNCSFMPSYEYTGKATWIPAFQGSGSDMLRTLVKAITGLGGDGVYDTGCFEENRTATCKTHWPLYPDTYPPNHYRHLTTGRVIMLIRNPKDSLPSSFNYKWEVRHHLKTHTKQAPEKSWNAWRDEEAIDQFMQFWVGQILTWKNLPDYDITFYLPYERLVNINTGPELLSKVAAELHSNGVHVAAKEDIPCLWYKVVKEGKSKKTKRAPHRYEPSFTLRQQSKMLSVLEFLQEDFADDLELVDILSVYYDDILHNMRVQEEDDDAVADT